ncbi:hypothetical protein GCM10010441_18020 [Kitasatospora paracochleata]|uniref:Protein kinase domain-containing protein n=1 Tax=Kitasatospora paracochleata TaxID=58354 RepID=A0ABT1J9N8_9ACTN|nr:serine/threonine-protein kinase [Kitasatospora paracochleata]MCP2314167.1 hypothetical protein [Kitasatospora paracochleata]
MSSVVFGFPVLREGDPGSLGDFRLVARLGEGGMGQVFLAFSPGGQLAAVKVIRGEFAGDAEFGRRFAREVAAAQKVRGAHLAPLLDADPQGERPWLAASYVAGPSLRDLVTAGGPLPAGEVMLLAWGIAQALADIHAADVVHRDLKPGNIMLDESGPKVIDFGIVKSLTQSVTYRSSSTRIGTPLYMSPEQALGRPVGPPSDMFALGSTLHFLATGREAFAADNEWAVAHRIVADRPDLTHLAPPLHRLIAGCLAKDPQQRPTPDQVRALCEAELGDALGPGAWMGVTGAREAIRQRTNALRTLVVGEAKTTGNGSAEVHPRTVIDAGGENRPAAQHPAPPADAEHGAVASPSGAASAAAGLGPARPGAEFVLSKSRGEMEMERDGSWPGAAVQAALAAVIPVAGVIFAFKDPASVSPGGVAMLLFFGAISVGMGIYSFSLRPPGPDVVTVDADGLTVQRQRWKLRRPTSYTIRWASISMIEVVGGAERTKKGALVRDERGRLKEVEPETELRVRFLDGHEPSRQWLKKHRATEAGDGWWRIYGPSMKDPAAVHACDLRDGLARFAGSRYNDPNPTLDGAGSVAGPGGRARSVWSGRRAGHLGRLIARAGGRLPGL